MSNIEFLPFIGAVIALLANIPLIVDIYRDKAEQSFATFFLWGLLDGVAAISIWLEGGNFLLPAGYTISATFISLLLLLKKKATWGKIESITALLVVICIGIWAVAGNTAGTIASVSALVIGSIPQIKDTYARPWLTPIGVYFLFSLGNFISFMGGAEWSVKEKLYPGSAMIVCMLLLILAIRKFFPHESKTAID